MCRPPDNRLVTAKLEEWGWGVGEEAVDFAVAHLVGHVPSASRHALDTVPTFCYPFFFLSCRQFWVFVSHKLRNLKCTGTCFGLGLRRHFRSSWCFKLRVLLLFVFDCRREISRRRQLRKRDLNKKNILARLTLFSFLS